MFDFSPTEEQRALIDTARRFARERIIPVAAACDREARFPKDVFAEAHAIGLVNPTLPAEYGGAGLSDVESSFITEELAYGCSGIQTSMTANTLGLTPIKLGGTDEQKKKYLGWLVKEPVMVSYATSEPGAGSDVAGLQCRATKDGNGGWVLNGTKQWITNATLASFYVVFATEDPALQHKGIGAFIVERAQSGVKPGRARGQARPARERHGAAGARGRAHPREPGPRAAGPGLQARDGDLQPDAPRHRRHRRAASCAAASTRSVAYARERKTFGVPIAQHQLVMAMLAEMKIRIEATSLLVPQGRVEPRRRASAIP